jgi:carbon monoxide dehydrogenase subunit G
MPSASNTITIHRPIADVFAFVADGLNGPRWRSGILDIAHASGEGLGAVYRQGVKGPGGRRIDADYEITGWDPPHHLAFRAIAGPVRPTGEYRLAESDGGTAVTFALDAQLAGIKKLLMGRAVQSTMDAEVANLARLKAVLEG